MSTRENTLAMLLLGFIFLAGGGFLGYTLILEPLWEKEKLSANLEQEIGDLELKEMKLRKDVPRLQVANKRSLPSDETLATREYKAMLERIVRQAYGGTVPPGLSVNEVKINEVRTTTPAGQPAKKPAFTRVGIKVEFKKADMWAVHDFLVGYYKLNLLHQITSLKIQRDEEGAQAKKGNTPDRKDLSVTLTTEALIVDGADPRRTLLPVPPAFAAVGGFAGFETVALTPEASRGISPTQFVQVLASRPRDYSLIVRKDVFHGPYVDPKAPVADIGDKKKERVKEDISSSIVLVSAVPASDGTAVALIRDSYNPHNYMIEANAREVKVRKYFFVGKSKKLDGDHPNSGNLLVISDENVSATHRTFKIIAVDAEGLIVQDLKPGSRAETKSEGKGGRGGASEAPMPRPGSDPLRPGPRPSVSVPLAGMVGAAGAAAAPPPLPVYRWPVGRPLKALVELPRPEAEKILQRAAAEGPVHAVAAAPSGE